MANPLYSQNKNHNGNPLDTFNQIRSMGPASAVFQNMYSNNQNFRQFADSVRGKSPEEAFGQYGLDFSKFRGMKW